MKLVVNSLVLLSLLANGATAEECGPDGGSIAIAGSSTVLPVAKKWAEGYKTKCPGVSVTVEGGGSSSGAGRVCDNPDRGEPVDIGNMSRDWKGSEAETKDGYTFECLAGDTSRQAIQIDVAIDGLSVVTQAGGAGSDCIASLGGLTVDQLRWIFSSYSQEELLNTGWDETALGNSDGDDSTHLWSELSADCPEVEIKISGPDDQSGTYEYMSETILSDLDNGETFDLGRGEAYFTSADDTELVAFLADNEDAISYFGFAYYSENTETLSAASIQNSDGDFIAPDATTVGNGSYNPLARRIFMNVLDNEESLMNTFPFIKYGLSTEEGSTLVAETGYVNVPSGEKLEMIGRLHHCPASSSFSIVGSSTVKPVAEEWAAVYMDQCPATTISIEGGGSSNGAGRVCGEESRGQPVEIGNMSRDWKSTEASTEDEHTFDCLVGNTDRSAIQVDVAIDGLSVVTQAGGAGSDCIASLGGLSIDQLRWIFSSYTQEELLATGWDEAALANSDGDDSTHLWSELSDDCPGVEIKIAGPDSESGTYEYMSETIFADLDNGEIFASDRPDGYFNSAEDEDIITYLEENADAIAFFGFAYFMENEEILSAAAIQNEDGEFVAPTSATVGGGNYNPLARRIYMNLLAEEEILMYTGHFVQFGLSMTGDALVAKTGYVPIPPMDKMEMTARINQCPPGGDIAIAGSSTVRPIAELWAAHYMDICPTTKITVEGGGSSNGAGRVCGEESRGEPVEIGNMSRDWKDTEAEESGDDNVMNCLVGDTSRSAVQVEVAIDGLSVVTQAEGAGSDCIGSLGGLSIDQLRWIFSSYTQAELVATGWDETALANSDGDDSTHLWSELSADCPEAEIKISGPDSESGTYEYFSETIFADLDNGEIFASDRPDGYFNSADDHEIIDYLASNPDAISYLGFAYYQENQEKVSAASIENVAPTAETVAEGSYPLARRIYMNLLNDEAALTLTQPFIDFGLGPAGAALVSETGYVPVAETTLADITTEVEKL